jgi:hypothetical protein
MATKKKTSRRKKQRRIAHVKDDGIHMEDVEVAIVCGKSHHKVPMEVSDLPENQKTPFRHVCAGCAYELGYKHGHAAALKALQSQATTFDDDDT